MFKELKEQYNKLKSPKEKFQWALSLIKESLIEFIICTLILYSPAWIPLVISAIIKSETLLSIGISIATFIASPLLPFWLLDIAFTLAVKAIIEKMRKKR